MAKITDITPQKNNRSRVNIFIDGEFFCGMEAIIAAENRLKTGIDIDISKLNEMTELSDIEAAFKKAVGLISKMLKTEKEMNNYLISKGYLKQTADNVISKLKEYDYINDTEYAAAYINGKKSGEGKKKLRYELKNKGISDKILDKVLDKITPEDQTNTIRTLTEKYISGKLLDIKVKKNLSNFLYARGFEWEDYIDIINQIFGEEVD